MFSLCSGLSLLAQDATTDAVFWKIADADSIVWDVAAEHRLPHADNIEMSGRKISVIISYQVDSNGVPSIDRKVIWPMLRVRVAPDEPRVNEYRAYLVRTYTDSQMPAVTIDGRPFSPAKVDQVKIDGTLSFIYREPGKWRVTRTLFPSPDKEILVEQWRIENASGKTFTVSAPAISRSETLQGFYGEYRIETRSDDVKPTALATGKSLSFGVYFSARKAAQPAFAFDHEKEFASRNRYLERMRSSLRLETPDPVLNLEFTFAKIRTAESVFETKVGLLHSPGGGRYYGGIWCNDQVEYSAPFFPYLGYPTVTEATINALRIFAKHRSSDYSPLMSSFEMETDLPCCGKDRGDAAMLAYGSTRFLMESGDRHLAEELWPAIEWYLEYCKRKTTSEGVIASDTDEMEGRIATGKANLTTSSLTYGALIAGANLAESLGKDPGLVDAYRAEAASLRAAIERYFGATIEGIQTYRYFDGHTGFRHWMGMPLVVGIDDRKEGVVRALYSKLWTPQGLLVQSGQSVRWDRATLYALNGTFQSGAADIGLEHLKEYTVRRLLGPHVPYPIEAWPEGDEAHLAAESALYGRIVTEGLFGMTPTGLDSFDCKPSMPKQWQTMKLSNIHGFNRVFDLVVGRKSDKIEVSIIQDSKSVLSKELPQGARAFVSSFENQTRVRSKATALTEAQRHGDEGRRRAGGGEKVRTGATEQANWGEICAMDAHLPPCSPAPPDSPLLSPGPRASVREELIEQAGCSEPRDDGSVSNLQRVARGHLRSDIAMAARKQSRRRPPGFYSQGMKLQQGAIAISRGARSVPAAYLRQSHTATTELRASMRAAASLSRKSASSATAGSKSVGSSSPSPWPRASSGPGSSGSDPSPNIAGIGRGLSTLKRKRKRLSSDQFNPDRMSSSKSRLNDSTSTLAFPTGTTWLTSTQ